MNKNRVNENLIKYMYRILSYVSESPIFFLILFRILNINHFINSVNLTVFSSNYIIIFIIEDKNI